MVPIQDVLIATSLICASGFLWGYLKWRVRRPLLLLVAAIMLGADAGYETYMHFVWEPTVHAPIRLDLFVLELPLILLGVLLGVCSMIGRKAPPG
jgi:hypothetical protein